MGRRKHLVFIRWITDAESTYGICVRDKKKRGKKALFTTSAGDVNAKLPVTFLESIESEGVGGRRES